MTVVVLTGVSRGLGRAMAVGFAASGCTVVGCGRTRGDLDSLRQQLGEPHRIDVVDVANDQQVAQWAAECLADGLVPDFLINNAAIINRNAPLWDIPAEEFDQLVAVNISGTANVLRHFVPSMNKRSAGVIVNFSSGWGRSVSAKVAPYCASKWAIEGMTAALAEEVADGVAAVALNPGVINTEMLQSCFGAGADMYPNAEEWASRAVPYILQLSATDNGRPLSVPE